MLLRQEEQTMIHVASGYGQNQLAIPAPRIKASGKRREWSETEWIQLAEQARQDALSCRDDHAAFVAIANAARKVLRRYSSSFFIVTRFLPRKKRRAVEVIYAAVRYPDEIVDTFPLTAQKRLGLLEQWGNDYEQSLEYASLRQALQDGLPPFAAAFAQVVRTYGIPREHYIAFLDAMRRDVQPEAFATLDDLIHSYIYGSAIVVGYFLTYVYEASHPANFAKALLSSRNLGIALQMTNFLRDVGEDRHRGRLYLPLDLLSAEGLTQSELRGQSNEAAIRRVLQRFAQIAEQYYAEAERDLDAFAPDCQTAIKACIDVYRALNQRVISSHNGIDHRESVPLLEKLKVLPASKYWRIPLAYMT